MAEMGGFGSIACYINAGFHPFNPNFRKVDSIYISEDNKTLMINTLSSTVFLTGLQVVDSQSISSVKNNTKED